MSINSDLRKKALHHIQYPIATNILQDLETGNHDAWLYMDLSKAFDMIDHEILLYKLHHYGIRGIVSDWFKSYLTNRRQYVHINGMNYKNKK